MKKIYHPDEFEALWKRDKDPMSHPDCLFRQFAEKAKIAKKEAADKLERDNRSPAEVQLWQEFHAKHNEERIKRHNLPRREQCGALVFESQMQRWKRARARELGVDL